MIYIIKKFIPQNNLSFFIKKLFLLKMNPEEENYENNVPVTINANSIIDSQRNVLVLDTQPHIIVPTEQNLNTQVIEIVSDVKSMSEDAICELNKKIHSYLVDIVLNFVKLLILGIIGILAVR